VADKIPDPNDATVAAIEWGASDGRAPGSFLLNVNDHNVMRRLLQLRR
jgi:hypothetical protein